MEAVQFSLEVKKQLRKLQARASRGLWALAIFLAFSIGAHRNFDFLPTLSESADRFLSGVVPTGLVNVALVLYSFAAISRTLSNLALGSAQCASFLHVVFLAGFYCFYYLAGTLGDNFWAVFIAGMIILSLESYHTWTYHQILLRELEKLVLRLEGKRED